MNKVAFVLIALIAMLHIYIAWFEVFAWTERGPQVFKTLPPELFEQTIALAVNQGVYNLFLAIGLIWSLTIRETNWQFRIASCFLVFIIVAGLTVAATIALRPGLIQIAPSSLALAVLWGWPGSKTLSRTDARAQ